MSETIRTASGTISYDHTDRVWRWRPDHPEACSPLACETLAALIEAIRVERMRATVERGAA